MRSVLPGWPWNRKKPAEKTEFEAEAQLRTILEDTSIPAAVRAELATEFDEIEAIADKIARDEIHIAAFGRVGVGKSSLLNALLGQAIFSTSPLHGETRQEGRSSWSDDGLVEGRSGHVVLIDTPGIDELGGAEREALAHRIARRSDIVLMVCAGDLVEKELAALQALAAEKHAVILVLNKADHYTRDELSILLQRLRERTAGMIKPERIIAVSADPRPVAGQSASDVQALRALLWDLLERHGKSLAALNATLFAADLDRQVASRIVEARRTVAARIVRNYCITKGLLVAANPVPLADLLAAAGTDIAMVIHLGEVYGFRLNRSESVKLLLTISTQLVALMGAYWGSNLLSSLLKTASAGFSTTLTAAAQGALAWYATLVTGRMAETWFAQGKSWGGRGPRETAREVLASRDRDEVQAEARDALAARLK